MTSDSSASDPIGFIAAALLESCVRHGEGDKDSTVIVEDIRRRVARPAAAQGMRS